MRLNLVHDRHDTRRVDDLLQQLNVEIGNTDRLDLFGLFADPHHLFPGGGHAGSLPVNDALVVLGWH
jgi:hypothetical protein